MNKQTSRLYSALGSILFEETITGKDGKPITYIFLGQFFKGNNYIQGEWFDKRKYGEGYLGSFQVSVAPNLHSFKGLWIGFSKTGKINSGELSFRKINS